jgi:hypothetical protein
VQKPVAYKFDDCCPGWRKLIGRIGPNNEWQCVAFVREMQKLWHFWFFLKCEKWINCGECRQQI